MNRIVFFYNTCHATNEPTITSVKAVMATNEKRWILLKYALHAIGAKTGDRVLTSLLAEDFFNKSIEKDRPDEYYNPPDSKSKFWDHTWIQGTIITINVPLSTNPLHTVFIFACITYGQVKVKPGSEEYIFVQMVWNTNRCKLTTSHTSNSRTSVKQPMIKRRCNNKGSSEIKRSNNESRINR